MGEATPGHPQQEAVGISCAKDRPACPARKLRAVGRLGWRVVWALSSPAQLHLLYGLSVRRVTFHRIARIMPNKADQRLSGHRWERCLLAFEEDSAGGPEFYRPREQQLDMSVMSHD